MADLQNTSKVDTNALSKPALVTDLNSSYVGANQYTHARNIVRNSKEGDLGTLGNEPSTISCIQAPYKIIGYVDLPDDTLAVFSTDNINSEIGVGNPNTCTYKKVYSNPCLGFNDQFPITGVSKKDFQKGIVVTFTDKNKSVKRVELNKLSTSTTCDDIELFKKITRPCIKAKKGQVGNMPNGVYSIVMAYVVDKKIFSDWYSITNRLQMFSETSSNSIEITLTDLDKEFKEFAIAVVGNYIDPVTKGATKLAKIIGYYSTNVRTVSITDFLNTTYQEIPLSNLVVQKKTWEKAGIITANANHLILGDLVSREEENYQLKAMTIEMEYVVEQVLADYYNIDGEDVGFYRDENYDFSIQGLYKTGEETDKFHIGGRKATSSDLASVSSSDVYEYDKQFNDCEEVGRIPRWKVENTAGKMIPYNNEFVCDRRILGRGKMGYFQSTDLYPDNEATYGDDRNTPIRYPKMPDECKVPRFSVVNGKTYINILGVRFKNIPKFDSPDIIGYKITRSDRKGGNGTIQARGIMTNVRSYVDPQIKQTVLYSNYNVNNLGDDPYLSSTQTVYKDGKETNFTPLKDFYLDKFSFYSPHTSFEPRYSLGTEVKIEAEEIADVKGAFEKVYNHPKQKLMNQFSFWLSAAVGAIEYAIILLGKADVSAQTSFKLTFPPNPLFPPERTVTTSSKLEIKTAADLISLSPGQLAGMVAAAAQSLDGGGFLAVVNLVVQALKVLASLALKGAYGALMGIKVADDMFTIIYNLTGYIDYVYQYNSHALFNRSICMTEGNKRRRLLNPATYIPSTVVTVGDKVFNNLLREKTVFLELNKPIPSPTNKDTSTNTISGFGLCENLSGSSSSIGSAFYATIKTQNPNQYGELGSSSPVSMHSCPLNFTGELTESPILYGGDCIISRFQFQKRMPFFNQNIANTNYPDGTEYDYRLYRNVAYPRFWADFTKYDFSQLLSTNIINFAKFNRTTSSKHNLDCKKKKDGGSILRIDNAYMYLSNNTVMDFFVESDYNPNFREKTDNPFYSKDNTNLSQIFRSDRLDTPEEFKISRVYNDIYTTEIFAQQQRDDFDPNNPIPVNQPNSVIYSLPAYNLQKADNWQYFLPANYFNFRESDFGSLTGIHKIDQDRLIYLFSKASPFVSMGRSLLQLNGQTITIGDGGMFAQDPRELMPTDNDYSSSTSRYAFSNTHMGRFYPSSSQGRIINYTQGLDDITRQGVSFWCKNYMPIFLYKYFPEYSMDENPVSGVGYLTAFDSFYETVYICKRDFSPKKEFIADISWDVENKTFTYKGKPISVRDERYFNDVSWTLSYSPLDKSFVSWHDWHPDFTIQRANHFMTVKGNKIWKHNESFDSFCNFYGIDYPHEIEPVSSSGQQVHTVRSIDYMLEVYKYKNFGRDRFHVLKENFDRLIVSNSEQISVLLNLVYNSLNPEENQMYPKRNMSNSVSYDVLYSKEEQVYTINQFWDATKDRGEFSLAENHLFPTDESGYKHVINPLGIDINKPEEQRKKFRHYFNKFRFIKTVSGPNKFLFKLVNIKKQVSQK